MLLPILFATIQVGEVVGRIAFSDSVMNPLAANAMSSKPPTVTFKPDLVASLNKCSGTSCSSSMNFSTPAAKAFEVGQQLPGIPFTLPNSWAGNLPVNKTTPDQQLWFWLWTSETATDTLTIWINGGPGCSSMIGAIAENGPFLYKDNERGPYRNPKSWTKLTNMLYVDQPIGVGYTVGKPEDRNEVDAARNFAGFLDNFYEAFPEMKGKKLFFTGESYAGLYLQFMAKYEYERGNPHNLQGIMIVDGVLESDRDLQESVTAYDYATHFRELLALNDTDLATIKAYSDAQNYTNYTADNLRYPLSGPLPPVAADDQIITMRALWNLSAAKYEDEDNFNLYNIGQRDSEPASILSDGPDQSSVWFSSEEVKKALHTSMNDTWYECSEVFANSTPIAPKDTPTLQGIIEQTNITVLVHGMWDMRLLVNGTKLVVQDTEWRGKRGFQAPPTARFYDSDGVPAGKYQTERGLSLVTVDQAGHMVPGDAPSSAFALLKFLLGQGELGSPYGADLADKAKCKRNARHADI
ncbi:hypothetical protein OC844_000177 [Tilletia horrida]|nr:hypothetical protein OC844_000177 [Tilletia horrida]